MPEPTEPQQDVPADLIDLACARFTDSAVGPGVEWIPMRRALAAVLPAHERMVRAQVADALLADADDLDRQCVKSGAAYFRRAAHRARGETP